MPLTPQQLAELQRLKELMRPQAEEFTRRMQAVANAEKGSGQGVSLPTDRKAKGGLAEFLKDSAVKHRVYHGTTKDFNAFKPGRTWFATDPEYANIYAGPLTETHGENGRVMPLHVRTTNPKTFNASSEGRGQWTKAEYSDSKLKAKGHDSVLFVDDKGKVVNGYAMHPTQVKSAIGNRGTYDPTNPDITKAKGGSVMGINVASDRKAGLQYADLIVDGHKTLESRNTDSLRPYVGKRVAIVRTGHGPAKAIGEVTIGEPMVVNKKKFRSLERQHMVPEGSAFDISTPTKHLYPLSNPQRYEQEHDVGHGIVARKVMHKATGGTIPSQDVMRLAIGGQGPKNWIKGGVEQVIDPMLEKEIVGNRQYPHGPELDEATRQRIAELQKAASQPGYVGGAPKVIAHLEEKLKAPDVHKAAMNQWIQRNLTNYIKKQMATHDDPIRKLAEQGIVHMPPEQMGYGSTQAEGVRKVHGAPRLGQSPEAQAWEDATDVAMHPMPIKDLHRDYREPWMLDADPQTKIYTNTDNMHAHYLGFDHLVDVLKQDLAEGRIRPEQMSKVSIEHAVRRAHEYDQERKKAMAQTALKATEGMPVHKDYGDGYKWIELALPKELPEGWRQKKGALGEDLYFDPKGENSVNPNMEKLEEALKYEGNTMGHCVGGYTPDVASGKSRIFSLRDAKNEPHVTIEVKPENSKRLPNENKLWKEFYAAGGGNDEYADPDTTPVKNEIAEFHEFLKKKGIQLPAKITQIKGKQNAKPKKDYIPYVQDFVKSGNWSHVGDLHNTDLHEVKEGEIPGFAQWMHIKAYGNVPKIPSGYYTPQELVRFGKESGLAQLHPSVHKKWIENLGLPPEDNKAHGGITHAHHLEIEERPL